MISECIPQPPQYKQLSNKTARCTFGTAIAATPLACRRYVTLKLTYPTNVTRTTISLFASRYFFGGLCAGSALPTMSIQSDPTMRLHPSNKSPVRSSSIT